MSLGYTPGALEPLHSVEDVAAALHKTPHYVKTQCRKRLWPHRRVGREVAFTAADYQRVLELTAEPVAEQAPTTGLAFAPRSKRGAA